MELGGCGVLLTSFPSVPEVLVFGQVNGSVLLIWSCMDRSLGKHFRNEPGTLGFKIFNWERSSR